MKVFRVLPALIVMLCTAAFAQVGGVKGVVKDQSGHAIKGATIVAESLDYLTPDTRTSDKKGRFLIPGLRPGEWILNVRAPGYEVSRIRTSVRAERRTPSIQIRLARSIVSPSLGGMTGPEIQQRIDAAEAAASRGDLDAAIAAYSDLATRVPGLTAAYLQLGALNERKHDTAAALAAYRRLLEIEPDNVKARDALHRLSGQRER